MIHPGQARKAVVVAANQPREDAASQIGGRYTVADVSPSPCQPS